MRDWKAARLFPNDSLLSAMESINRTTYGIVLIVDSQDHLLGTVVDGDIRRAVLAGMSLESAVDKVMKVNPVTAEANQAPETYLNLMLAHKVQQLPLLEKEGKVLGLILLKDLHSEFAGELKAVIMAGGLGTRLRPLTDSRPKPMLPLGDRPIMEHVIAQLRESGIREVVVSTHYKSEVIQNHFGDGSACGLTMKYVNEEDRYGTIGALRLMRDQLQEPFLVINGDILTTLDFSAMRIFHSRHHADMTVAVRKHDFHVPYGVMQVEGEAVIGLQEKPTMALFINAGIYLMNPEMIDYIPEGQFFDAPDLITKLIENKRRVVAFPVIEYWVDIGYPRDYEQAIVDFNAGQIGDQPR